jgi:nitrogen regulatory protein P-II 1
MKKIEALIIPRKVEEVKTALAKFGVKGMTFSEVRDYGHHPSHVGNYRGSEYIVDLLPEVKIEVVSDDEDVSNVTETIINALQTEPLGDGEITILPMEEVLHVRSGVR